MRNIKFLTAAMLVLISCAGNNDQPDAWGNFESREVIVSSEASGKILRLQVNQGDILHRNELIAIVDTSIVKLQIDELKAGRQSLFSKIESVDAQNNIIDQQIANLKVNIERVGQMLADKAATQKQYDDLEGQIKVLLAQKEANDTQKSTIRSELNLSGVREAILREQLDRCYIRCPEEGTVLEKYAEEGELTATGKPVIKIADLNNMELKVYVSGAQLSSVKSGQSCRVRIDRGVKDYSEYTGKVIHISDKAEFTPKIIQTKEERVHLVYAVKISVKNDGVLKNGMPGEAYFTTE